MLGYLEIYDSPRQFMLSIWSLIQVFDDIHDGDSVDEKEFNSAMWSAFIYLPTNDFYRQNGSALASVISTQIFKWRAANHAEKEGLANEQSFMWRAGYFDILMLVYSLVYGVDRAQADAYKVMNCYIETIDQYYEEFKGANNETS